MQDNPANGPVAGIGAAYLEKLLRVSPQGDDVFLGIGREGGTGRSFGGQVIGQALMAATATVPPDRPNHSLHVYFMRPGRADEAVQYNVSRDMDGRSFATRRVVAVQRDRPILTMAASFQRRDEGGLEHQVPFPDGVPRPEDLPDLTELASRYDGGPVTERMKGFFAMDRPIDIRPVGPTAPFDMSPVQGPSCRWFRSRDRLGNDPVLHRAALAYMTDMGILQSALSFHGRAWLEEGAKVASLDHALWQHDDFRADEWLLYVLESPWAGHGRGLGLGKVFRQDGRLVASVAQEGMMRLGN